MATDMFLRLENVDGESKDMSHEDEIDILSWSWGASNSGSFHSGGGGGGIGKCSIQDLTVTKWVDKASTRLMEGCVAGRHFTTGQLTVRKAGGQPLEYITLELEGVLITSVSVGGSGDQDRLTESVTLNFRRFTYRYTPQKEDGMGDAPLEFPWDIQENAPY